MTDERSSSGAIDLLFAGSVFCDLVFAGVATPEPGAEVYAEAFAFTAGGVATRAVAGARLGARTVLLSQLGDDPLGTHVAEVLAREPNLDLTWLQHREGFQSPVTVSLTGQHEREFITYQETATPLEWPPERPNVAATHVSLQRELPDWVARLRRAGTVVYGGVGWDSSGEWSRLVIDRLAAIDVFVPNDSEAMRYTRTDTPTAAARELGRHVGLAVVTCGSRGVVAYDQGSDRLLEIPAVPVAALDSTGAGDVFVASFMASGGFAWPLEQRLRLAGLAASLSVRTLGGAVSAPHPGQIATYLSSASGEQAHPSQDWSAIQDWATAQPCHQPATIKEQK
ncbi:MAG: carbohydrate kinase family protein [Propionibacteriaceae bacterium]